MPTLSLKITILDLIEINKISHLIIQFCKNFQKLENELKKKVQLIKELGNEKNQLADKLESVQPSTVSLFSKHL